MPNSSKPNFRQKWPCSNGRAGAYRVKSGRFLQRMMSAAQGYGEFVVRRRDSQSPQQFQRPEIDHARMTFFSNLECYSESTLARRMPLRNERIDACCPSDVKAPADFIWARTRWLRR